MPAPAPLGRYAPDAMNTIFEVIVAGAAEADARGAAGEAFREIDRLQKMMDRFDASSDIGQVSR